MNNLSMIDNQEETEKKESVRKLIKRLKKEQPEKYRHFIALIRLVLN